MLTFAICAAFAAGAGAAFLIFWLGLLWLAKAGAALGNDAQ